MRLNRAGDLSVVEDDLSYPNGLAVGADGCIYVTEGQGLLRIDQNGSRSWFVDKLTNHGGDGHCVDVDGRHYVAMMLDAGVQVFDRDGARLDFIESPGGKLTTNCCFGGPEQKWLFMADGATGNITVVRDMPAPGRKVALAHI